MKAGVCIRVQVSSGVVHPEAAMRTESPGLAIAKVTCHMIIMRVVADLKAMMREPLNKNIGKGHKSMRNFLSNRVGENGVW
jgi:hypothetical protein